MKVRLPASDVAQAFPPASSRSFPALSDSNDETGDWKVPKTSRLESLLYEPRRPGGATGAFTLIELMVVVVLIGIMTAMIIPEMKGTYEDALLRSTARKLVGILNLAYSQAVTVSEPHRVRLDRKSGRYVVEKPAREGEGASGFMPVRNVTGSEGELDTRISIDIRNPEEDPALPKDPESPLASREQDAQGPAKSDLISFYPDGTADDKEIMLRDREGFRLALRINPTTARVRIIEVDRE